MDHFRLGIGGQTFSCGLDRVGVLVKGDEPAGGEAFRNLTAVAGAAGGAVDIDPVRPDPEAVQRLLEQDAHMCKFHPAKTSRV